MLDSKLKTFMLGLSAALALTAPPAQAAATIKVAVDTIFANAANEIVSAFQYYYPTSGYSVIVTAADSAALANNIIAGSATYDLFLAGSRKQPINLAVNHSSLVVGAPFKYAEDFLALYSPTTDVSHGLPHPLTTTLILPNPATDPYGKWAALALALAPLHIWNIPSLHVEVAPDASTSYAAIDSGAYALGFVANSSICSLDANNQQAYPAGSTHYLYASDDDSHRRHRHHWRIPLRSNKLDSSVMLAGVKLASSTRTADQEAELNNFIAFLTGTADLNGSVFTAGTELIEGHCFEIPATP
ncbi:substrate-binding domain-containing protein [Methylosinus sp. Sm6]|uniref:molybdate ABC transporter substrate-binding protein n=1 Tax=Methylosinus sp. Sm6 TaxID=2866948 RepID=UPI001C99BAE6|nr:substrate-binding domain-containing protein [Methylosinus sp. Sm6]MBY6240840.1 substrate-binding domain-containing protein [Methylosinus sp. Sm6]